MTRAKTPEDPTLEQFAEHARRMRFLTLLAILAGCYHATATDPELEAVRAAVQGWTAVFGEPDGRACDVDLTTVVHPRTLAEFDIDCSWSPAKPGTSPKRPASCLRYQRVGLRRSAPRIFLRPDLTDAEVLDAVIHESLHNLIDCELRRSPWDPFDALHTDPRVWQSAGGTESAQSRAREAL